MSAYIHICSFIQQELHHLSLATVCSIVQGLSTTLQRSVYILILGKKTPQFRVQFLRFPLAYLQSSWRLNQYTHLFKLFPMKFTEKRNHQHTHTGTVLNASTCIPSRRENQSMYPPICKLFLMKFTEERSIHTV